MLKQELRKLYKQKRLALSATEKLKLDDLLLIQLQKLSLPNDIHVIMSYWPLEQHGEMNLHLYTRYIEHAFPNIKVTYPVINAAIADMQAVLVGDDTDFVENEYKIPEPETGEQIAEDEIDLVFVPLLAFDVRGYRVGFGKGFYDRFLSKCREDVLTIGFSYFEAVDRIDDTNQFDIPLNYCITPEKIYEF